jgi:hypothetical protein
MHCCYTQPVGIITICLRSKFYLPSSRQEYIPDLDRTQFYFVKDDKNMYIYNLNSFLKGNKVGFQNFRALWVGHHFFGTSKRFVSLKVCISFVHCGKTQVFC